MRQQSCLHLRLPMAAVSGCEDAKLALSLLAVEPRLKGAVIASGPGTSKSLIARSFETILPESDYQDGCALVEVPLNVSEDRLLGGIDIELALATGRREAAAGLLERAHGRALYVDEINLLDAGIINHLAAALDCGRVRLEREGISSSYASDFVLIATYDPAEGELSQVIKDRAGLLVHQHREASPDRRAEIASLAMELDRSPFELAEAFENENASIKKMIEEARERLPHVIISRESVKRLSQAALALGVSGNRADIFAARAALASAALAGRASVEDDDLALAIRLVLAPRANRLPEPDSHEADESRAGGGEPSPEPAEEPNGPEGGFGDLLMKAIDSPAPLDLPAILQGRSARPAAGKHIHAKGHRTGRYVASSARRSPGARVAIDATLRAAAPHQSRRASAGKRVRIKVDDLRFKLLKRRTGMLVIFAVDASGSMALNRVAQAKGAMMRLLEESYLKRDRVAFISFRGDDANVLLQPTRSVALGKRLIDSLPTGGPTPIARGLLCALDVARYARVQDKTESLLLIFTDGRANVGLRTGHISDRVRREAAIREELRLIGAAMRSEGVHPVVIDTRSKYVSEGEGRALADCLGGQYLYLPRADADSISSAVRRIEERINHR